MRPRRIAIICKAASPRATQAAARAVDVLRGRVKLVADPATARVFGLPGLPVERMAADAVLCVGGDGTILRTLQALKRPVPVLGVNLGTIGFLADVAPSRLEERLRALLAGFQVEERMRLDARVNGRPMPPAMNETVVLSATPGRMLHHHVAVDGQDLLHLRADGLIFATPTGSTAYAMSAGGPIVDPRLEAVIVVPLAAFTLTARPILVHPESTVSVRVSEPAAVSVDGVVSARLKGKEAMTVSRAAKPARFVRLETPFFEKARRKFMEV
ncbi:MAG: NAD(+)/NADH kinase [Halobacteria archaeon]